MAEILIYELYNPRDSVFGRIARLLNKNCELRIPVDESELPRLKEDVDNLYNEIDKAMGTGHLVLTDQEALLLDLP